MKQVEVVIPKTWRSEWGTLLVFVVLSLISTYLSSLNQWSVIRGELFSIGDSRVMLTLPLFWLFPAGAALTAIYRVYNVRYCLDTRGIEAKVGVLGPWQKVSRIRFEDVRGVEYQQSVIDRLLNIGSVEIGTAATGEVEIVFQGVEDPYSLQNQLQRERDARIDILHNRSRKENKVNTEPAQKTA